MLSVLSPVEFDRYVDFAYGLALDMTKSAYPTYADGIKTKEDFIQRAQRAFEREHEEILLFETGGSVEGWIHYYALPDDDYVSFCAFNVRSRAAQAVDEIIGYLRPKYPGCTLYFGLPAQNADAAGRLKALGFACEEESHVDVLHFDDYVPQAENGDFVRVTRENFPAFAGLHRVHDDDMYWNNARLFDDLENWRIYLLLREERPAGAIYYCFPSEEMVEIFGVDYADNAFDAGAFRALLVKALNESKRSGSKHMVFFNGDDEHPVVSELGFESIGDYVLFAQAL